MNSCKRLRHWRFTVSHFTCLLLHGLKRALLGRPLRCHIIYVVKPSGQYSLRNLPWDNFL